MPAIVWLYYFNPRSREGSDLIGCLVFLPKLRFQSTLPRRERLKGYGRITNIYLISIHAPAKGATPIVVTIAVEYCISIHAPAKGATRTPPKNIIIYGISIHAPAKGATIQYLDYVLILRFQSTLPRRERPTLAAVYIAVQLISIHAPAKGATINSLKGYTICDISIHAPAKGATISTSRISADREFQSTLPRRERRVNQSCNTLCGSISIHAPAKGATKRNGKRRYYNSISIHAPAKGATCSAHTPKLIFVNFNPRSREGSDLLSSSSLVHF